MAPERIRGAEYSTSSDVWSLGMISLECAQGSHPYACIQSYYDLVVELSEGVEPPTLQEDLFSQPIREFTSACLCSRPTARASAATLLGHQFILSSHGHLGGAKGAQPTTAQLLTIAAFRLRDWVRQTFAQSSLAIGATSSCAGACACNPQLCISPCSAHSAYSETPSAASVVSSEDESAARIQAAIRGAHTRRELEEMRELVRLSALEDLPSLYEDEVTAVAHQLGNSHLSR